MGGLRIEHRLRCTVSQLYDEKFMQGVLPFLSVRGTNTYLQREHHGSHVPRLLVRMVPRPVLFWQASHFLLLLRARMAASTKASSTTPVDKFLFAWLAQCCGLVTVRWQKEVVLLLRQNPELWYYINGVRTQLRFGTTSFRDCVALRDLHAAPRAKKGLGFLELNDLGENHDVDAYAPACDDGGRDDHDDDGVSLEGLLQAATRVRSELLQASSLLQAVPEMPHVSVDIVDVTDAFSDAHIAAQFVDFEQNVMWTISQKKGGTATVGAFGHHKLRGLFTLHGCVAFVQV